MPTERECLEERLAKLQAERDRVQADKEHQEAKVEADEALIEDIDYARNAIQVYMADHLPLP
jgi:hypothetical protein